MTCFLCLQCGVQFAATETPPQHCTICEDERQYVRWEGQAWITPQQLAAEEGRCRRARLRHRAALRHRPAGAAGAFTTRQCAVGLRLDGERRGGGGDQPSGRAGGYRHLALPLLFGDGRMERGVWRRTDLSPCRRPAVDHAAASLDCQLARRDAGHQPVADTHPLRRPLCRRPGAALETRRCRCAADRRHPAGDADTPPCQFHVQLSEPDPAQWRRHTPHRGSPCTVRLRRHLPRMVEPEHHRRCENGAGRLRRALSRGDRLRNSRWSARKCGQIP